MQKNATIVEEMQDGYGVHVKEMREAVGDWAKEIREKLALYSDAEMDMKRVMREMREWMAKGRHEVDKRDKKIAQLESENELLSKEIEKLLQHTKQWNSQRDREVKKWKDISLLTIPLVEMVNKTLSRGSQQAGTSQSAMGNSLSASVIDSLKRDLSRSLSAPDVMAGGGHSSSNTAEYPSNNDVSPLRVSASLEEGDMDNVHDSTTVIASLSPQVPSVIVRKSSTGFEQHPGSSAKISAPSFQNSPEASTIRLSLASPAQETDAHHHSPSSSSKQVELQLSASDNWTRDILKGSSPSKLNNNSPFHSNIVVLDAPSSITWFTCKRLTHQQLGHKSRSPAHIDGFARRAKFFHPVAVAINQQKDTCIVAEAGNHCLRKVNLQDNLVSTLTNPSAGKKTSASRIDCPGGICFDPIDATKLYLTDLNQGKIFSVDTQNGAVSTIKMKSTTASGGPKQALSTNVPFSNAYDCTMSPFNHEDNNTLYVSHDTGIAIINLKSRDVTLIGSTKTRGCRDGSFQKALFDRPNGMTFLDQHRLLVCDNGNHVLREINFSTNTVSTFSGRPGYPCLRDESIALACFSSPRKICMLHGRTSHFVFITEENANLRVIDMSEQRVYTLDMKQELDSPFGIGAKFSNDEQTMIELFVADCNAHIIAHMEIDLFDERRSVSEEDSFSDWP